ncbi:hypothetical protein J6590_010376 [Homalodisca vitripennis]|nr:hypothetical protein J6590_010376 [Homalodisca vitripennis]
MTSATKWNPSKFKKVRKTLPTKPERHAVFREEAHSATPETPYNQSLAKIWGITMVE